MDKDILYRYFSHTATEEERAGVRRWVEESPANLRQLMEERALFDATVLLAGDDAGLRRPLGLKLRRMAVGLSKIAAVAVVTLILAYIARTYIFPMEIPMQEISVPAGQQLNMRLADGSEVWLNSKTTLRYPAMFTGGERRVEIDGEGYFKVAKDAGKPFRVATHGGTVEVLGTTFDVEAYESEGNFSTSLIEGKVKVSSGGREYLLQPGQRAWLSSDGSIVVSGIDDYDSFRWHEGIISLKDNTFPEIMKKFEKYYGVTVVIDRKGLQDVSYSGKFYQSDGIEYALHVLQHDMDFEFEKEKDRRIIHIK
ncbi:MAG TPA: FecR domain-containing protein [Candidatus Limisoma gallistercoris]|nr:FecR domain-containing protein [Candidatus Limisoma gallistercoris]